MAHTGRHDYHHEPNAGGEIAFQKKERQSARRQAMDDSLNVNSLMDIMTILLVFLLVSITSDPWNVKQNQFMQLAVSSVDRNPEESLAILVTKRGIVVDEDETVPLTCTTSGGRQCRSDADFGKEGNTFKVDKAWKEDSSEASFLIPKLLTKLNDEMEFARGVHSDLVAKGQRTGPFRGITTIICDRDIPYRIIAEVVHTAGNAGIDQLRFAVMRNSSR